MQENKSKQENKLNIPDSSVSAGVVNSKKEDETIFHIYDRIFKRIFNLSNTAIINLINGLFNKNYPPDSKIFYANKEFVKRNLQGRVADIFINIDGDTFHLEAMVSKDMMIQVRVMEYGFYYAMENQEDVNVLDFPEPMVIYLNEEKNIPEYSVLKLRFKGQGTFDYRVKNFLYQEHDIVELNQRKLIILIPF